MRCVDCITADETEQERVVYDKLPALSFPQPITGTLITSHDEP